MRILSYILTSAHNTIALLGLLVLSLVPSCYAQTDYFIQDFSDLIGYTSTAPNNMQFDVMGATNNASIVINGGKLIMTRVTNPGQAFLIRSTDFSPVPSTLYLEVDINVPIVTANIIGAAIFNVGQNIMTNGTATANANLFARFSINLGVNNTYQIRNTPGGASGVDVNSTTYASSQTVKVIMAMNNGSISTTYFDPSNANAPKIVLQPGTYDIWVNNVPLVLGRGKLAGPTGNVALTDFNFLFNSGGGTIVIDNLRIRDISGVLPVRLTYFNAEPIANKVELAWETAWERNSREFVVQRSNDLKEFGDIGLVTAAGEADGRRQYTFTDPNPQSGPNYYRLRMVDRDGTYEFSKVKDVVVHSDQLTMLVGPNPTTGDRIRLRTSVVDVSAMTLANMMGQNIAFRINQNSDGYTELIPSSVLAPGMYFLSLNQEGFRSHIKVLVQ